MIEQTTTYQWVMIGLIVAGHLGTGLFGAFKLGRVVEQMRAGVKEQIEEEREKIIAKLEAMEERFDSDQRTQDHNFGEVGAAVRQYIADVEKKVREVEIFGRDNYVRIPDFEKAIDRMGDTIKEAVAEIKQDMRQLLKKPGN